MADVKIELEDSLREMWCIVYQEEDEGPWVAELESLEWQANRAWLLFGKTLAEGLEPRRCREQRVHIGLGFAPKNPKGESS